MLSEQLKDIAMFQISRCFRVDDDDVETVSGMTSRHKYTARLASSSSSTVVHTVCRLTFERLSCAHIRTTVAVTAHSSQWSNHQKYYHNAMLDADLI